MRGEVRWIVLGTILVGLVLYVVVVQRDLEREASERPLVRGEPVMLPRAKPLEAPSEPLTEQTASLKEPMSAPSVAPSAAPKASPIELPAGASGFSAVCGVEQWELCPGF